MSNQAYITGDLQIRSLTGALTATSGVVSSLPLGTANGVATLGSDGKVPSSQLPTMGSSYKGTWDASTNTPYIHDGTGTAGDYYLVSTGGTQNLGSGSQTFVAGNSVIYSGTIWQKAGGGSGTVTSVGFTAPAAFTVTGSPITSAGTIALTGAGSGSQYIKGDGTLATFPTIPTISGTNNYVTKFTSGSTIGNSVIYDNGTNVGIGTTSPGDLLQIGSSTTRGTMSIFGTSSARPVLQFNNNAASGGNAWNLYAGLTAAGSFDIYDGGALSTRFSITNGGNVLIGGSGTTIAVNTSLYNTTVGRVNNTHGDRNLICACLPIEAYAAMTNN